MAGWQEGPADAAAPAREGKRHSALPLHRTELKGSCSVQCPAAVAAPESPAGCSGFACICTRPPCFKKSTTRTLKALHNCHHSGLVSTYTGKECRLTLASDTVPT